MRGRRSAADRAGDRAGDRALLDELRQALASPAPSARSVDDVPSLAALHQAVEARRDWPTRGRPAWWQVRPKIAIPALAGSMILAGSSVAFAVSGKPLPPPVRTVAHAVGLPVDSNAVAAARSDTAALRTALNRDDATSVAADAERLRSRLGTLSADDHQDLGSEPEHLLVRADNLIHSGGGHDQERAGRPATPSSTTTTEPRGEDHTSGQTTSSAGDHGNTSSDDNSTSTTVRQTDGGGGGSDGGTH